MSRKCYSMILLILFFLAEGLVGCSRVEPSEKPVSQKDGGNSVRSNLPTTQIGEFLIGVTFDPSLPKRGRNKIDVTILSKEQASPIRPEQIEITAVMPAMGTMSEMQSQAETAWQVEKGSTVGELILGMGGTWFLEINFHPAGGATPAANQQQHKARFKLVTGSPLVFLGGSIAGIPTDNPSPAQGAGMPEALPPASGVTTAEPVVISKARQQWVGVKTERVTRRSLMKTIRTVGRVTYDERTRSEVALKFSGFIGEVFADFVGKSVHQGSPLFTVYSPELSAAIGEYLNILSVAKTQTRSTTPARDTIPARGATLPGALPLPEALPHAERHESRWEEIIKTAQKKLLLWDITPQQIDKIAETSTNKTPAFNTPQYLPILSPSSGIVVEKQIVRGSPVMAGQILYRLADLSTVWIESPVYESELSLVQTGLPVIVRPIGLPDTTINGFVSFITPGLNPESRAGQIRIEVKNQQGKLLPEMSVTVEIEIPLGERLSLPKEAIIHTGDKTIVFVDISGGKFMPKIVKIGRKGDHHYEVITGVSEGEIVVTNGNFLIASESRLTAGLAAFLEQTTTAPAAGVPASLTKEGSREEKQ